MNDFRVFDIHVHPSLKTYISRKKLYKAYRLAILKKKFNPLYLRTNLPMMHQGNVRSIMATLYCPERGLFDDCRKLDKWAQRCGRLNRRFLEVSSGQHNRVTWWMMNQQEKAICQAQQRGYNVLLVKTFGEWQLAMNHKKTAFIHTLEGAHALEGDMDELHSFFNRGVALMTLAHHYENQVTHSGGGIPGYLKTKGCFLNNIDQKLGLKDFGKDVVEEMINIGMIIDLAHSTKQTVKEVFDINNKRSPVVLSHGGVTEFHDHTLSITDEDLQKIADCNGVFGVIFSNFWLMGGEDVGGGMGHIVNTIKHVKKKVGIDYVCIGTDFDGYTNAPDDIVNHAGMPRLARCLLANGFTEDEVSKVFFDNAARVLKQGWKFKHNITRQA